MIETRKAGLADIEQLSVLFDGYRVFYQKESDLTLAKEFLKERIERRESVVFVSLKEKQITGFVQLYPLFSSTRMRPLWLLNDLFVDPAFRGQGISVALIEKSKQHCRDTKACGLILETARTNEIGNNLYPRTGFIRDEEHNYYSWDV